MTLILSCISPENVLQVSDRRLTFDDPGSSGVRIAEDDRNKMVFWNRIWVFSYTGLAKIRESYTDIWLAEILSGSSIATLSDATRAIKSAAEREIHGIRPKRPHAFVGVGWARKNGVGPLNPFICSISNGLDSKGKILPVPGDEFNIHFFDLPKSSPIFIYPAGQRIPAELEMELIKNARRCIEKQAGPGAFESLLVHTIRGVAKKNQKVGNSILTVCLPRMGISNGMLLADSARLDLPSFHYFPAGKNVGEQYGPLVVEGCNVLSDLKVEYGDNPADQTVSAKIHKIRSPHRR